MPTAFRAATPRRAVAARRAAPPRRASAAAASVTAALLLGAAAPAAADTSARGPEGQTLTVSEATGLSPAGETVTVRGSGYDENKGIYVAFCVDNGPGVLPTPCGGGADTSGSLGASHWISSNPPSYGEGLAVPYGDGGSFSVTLNVTGQFNEVDCTARACAVVTRADHTRSADRTQDVRIPISFGGGSGSTTSGDSAAGGGEPAAAPEGADAAPDQAPDDAPDDAIVTPGPVPAAAATPVDEALAVTRVSASDTAGRWWRITTGGLVALLVGLVLAGRLARRRRRAGR